LLDPPQHGIHEGTVMGLQRAGSIQNRSSKGVLFISRGKSSISDFNASISLPSIRKQSLPKNDLCIFPDCRLMLRRALIAHAGNRASKPIGDSKVEEIGKRARPAVVQRRHYL
jgi:hypothetical protein